MRFLLCALVFAGCNGSQVMSGEATTLPLVKHSFAPPLVYLRLPRNFTPTLYAAILSVDPMRPTFDGVMTIAGALSERSSVIWLHGRRLKVRAALARQGAATVRLRATPRGDDLLELTASTAIDRGALQLQIEYSGEIDDVNTTGMFREVADELPYVFTQFESIYARRVFPCIDEPDSKVPWKLTLDVPKNLVAVSNAKIAADLPLGNRHRVQFEPTKPLPPYLIAFGIGPFEIVSAGATSSGIPVHIFTLKGRNKQVAYAAATATRLIDQLEVWFGSRFPYPKLDFLTVPLTSGFSAMENAGLIAIGEMSINIDPRPSWSHRVNWIRTASHELAHQWFGDLVTAAWWDDIWLNEAFAQWMENKMISQFQPGWQEELEELDTRASALAADSLVGARRIRQGIEITDDILNVFDEITYDKGSTILGVFENYIGRDRFQSGVRAYLADRAWGNATSADFVAAVSKVAGEDLGPAFATFLDQAGAPQLDMKVVCNDGVRRIEFSQQRFVPPGSNVPSETKPWIMPVCIAYDNAGQRAVACKLLGSPAGSLMLNVKACPRWATPNANGRGYFFTRYTVQQVTSLRDAAWSQLLPAERIALFDDVVNSVRFEHGASRLPLSLALSLVPKLLAMGDRFAIRHVLSFLQAIDSFVDDDQRPVFEAWHRAAFGPAARRVGFVARDTDTVDMEMTRASLILAAARSGRDPGLTKQAVELAVNWRALPQAIRGIVLNIATDSDQVTFERVRSELAFEPSRDYRASMIYALAQVRDPARYRAALASALDSRVDFRETQRIVFAPTNKATRALAEKFYRDHKTECDQRWPADEVSGALSAVTELLTFACDAKQRDAIVEYLAKNISGQSGGERVVKEQTERLDQCIASRRMLAPEIRAWLSRSRATWD